MAEEQITAFLAAVKADAGLEEKLKSSKDLDGAVAIANEAGFSVSKDAWLSYQAEQSLALSDDEVAGLDGGNHLLFPGGGKSAGTAF
jgi:predicted ribosomally synthesized peptide with nif11-like leader